MPSPARRPLAPFVMTALLVVLDQITKALVVARVELGTIAWKGLGDFLWIVRQQNTGIAFSMGDSLSAGIRTVLFIGLPLVLVVGLLIYYFRSDEPTGLQRWLIAGIVAGGIGNLIDRVFRPAGVVDFISLKTWGLLGMERFATFNVADACTTCSVILLAITLLMPTGGEVREGKAS